MEQPRQDSYGRSSPFKPTYLPQPPDPRAYMEPPRQPPAPYWQYGLGGSAGQAYNNIQNYQAGLSYNPEPTDAAQREQEARWRRDYASNPMTAEYQAVHGLGSAGQMREILSQGPVQELNAQPVGAWAGNADQNMPGQESNQQELGAQAAPANEGELIRNNYHYRQRMAPQASHMGPDPGVNYPGEQAGRELLPPIGEQEPVAHGNHGRPPLPQQIGDPFGLDMQQPQSRSKQRCFARGHTQCNSTDNLLQDKGQIGMNTQQQAPPDQRDVYLDMKQFDADLRRNKWKNKDHFHLVQVEDVYSVAAAVGEQENAGMPEKGMGDPAGALTATVYSQDSNAKREVKANKQRYAQILVEQMKQKKEKRLKEKAERQSMAVDLDAKAGPRVMVPDIPRLIHQQDSKSTAGRPGASPPQALRQRYRTLSPADKDKIQQANYGFFENLYGPEQEMRKRYQRAREAEVAEHLQGQMLENQARKADQRFSDRYAGLLGEKAANATRAAHHGDFSQFVAKQMGQFGGQPYPDNAQWPPRPWPGGNMPPMGNPSAQMPGAFQAPSPYQQQPAYYPQQFQQYPEGQQPLEQVPPQGFLDNAMGAAPPSGQHSPNAFMRQQENQHLLQVPKPPEQLGMGASPTMSQPLQAPYPEGIPGQAMNTSMTSTPPRPGIHASGGANMNSRGRGVRRHLHENSMTLAHEPNNAGRPPFSPFQLNPPYPQLDPAQALEDKERYKAELRQQMHEKKAREAEDKRRKLEEDLKEELRVKREQEELLRQFQEFGSEHQANQGNNNQNNQQQQQQQKSGEQPENGRGVATNEGDQARIYTNVNPANPMNANNVNNGTFGGLVSNANQWQQQQQQQNNNQPAPTIMQQPMNIQQDNGNRGNQLASGNAGDWGGAGMQPPALGAVGTAGGGDFLNKYNNQPAQIQEPGLRRQQSTPLKEQMHMDTNLIADAVNARQVALNKEANRPNERDATGRIRPPNKQDVEFQAALEQNMQVFANSIAQMRSNHANLMQQYNREIQNMQQYVGQTEKEAVEAQTQALASQIQTIQDEMDKIVRVVEQTGESIIGSQAQSVLQKPDNEGMGIRAGAGVPQRQIDQQIDQRWVERQPMIKLTADQQPLGQHEADHPSQMQNNAQKKKRIMVNLDSKPTSVKSKYRARPPIQQKPYLKPKPAAPEEQVKIVQQQPSNFENLGQYEGVGDPEGALVAGYKDQELINTIQMQIDAENAQLAHGEGAADLRAMDARSARDSAGALLERRNSVGQLPPLQHQVSIKSRRSTRSGGPAQAPDAIDHFPATAPGAEQPLENEDLGPALVSKSSLKRQQTLPALAIAPTPPALDQDVATLEKQLLSARETGALPNAQLAAIPTGDEARLSQRSRRSGKHLPPLAPTSTTKVNLDIDCVQSQAYHAAAPEEQAIGQADDAAINLDKQSHSNFDTQAPAQEVIEQRQILESQRAQEQAEAVDFQFKLQTELPGAQSVLVQPEQSVAAALNRREPQSLNFRPVEQATVKNTAIGSAAGQNIVQPMGQVAGAQPAEQPAEGPPYNLANNEETAALGPQQVAEQPLMPAAQAMHGQAAPVSEAVALQELVEAIVSVEAAPASSAPQQQVQNADVAAVAAIEEVTLVMAPPAEGPPVQQAPPPELQQNNVDQQVDLAAKIQQIREADEEEAQRLKQAELNRQSKMQQIVGNLATQRPEAVDPVPAPGTATAATQAAAWQQQQQIRDPGVHEKVVVTSNQVDGSLFEQRVSIREAVKQTANIQPLNIKQEQDFYEAAQKRLYAEQDRRPADASRPATDLEKQEKGLNATINPHLYKSAEFTLNPVAAHQLAEQAAGVATQQDGEAEPVAVADLFTNDSKVNDKNIIRQFQVEQKQIQDAAYRKQGRAFGCYGPIEEEPRREGCAQGSTAGNLALSEVEERYLRQKPLKYSKNDPFGVNMRLRQSLSSTNQILFRQDNQRYIESMATTFAAERPQADPLHPAAPRIYPSSSRDKLNQLNTKAKEMLISQDLHYDPELFRDETDVQIGVGESQHEEAVGEEAEQQEAEHEVVMKVGDIISKPLPPKVKTARFQQEVIQSLAGSNPAAESRREGGSARLPASGYQPNFNFSDAPEQLLPKDGQQNQYMAFQLRNSELFQPAQEVLFVDQQHQMLFNGNQIPPGVGADQNVEQVYEDQTERLAQLYRDTSMPLPSTQHIDLTQQLAETRVDSSLSQQQQQKIAHIYGNSSNYILENIQEQPEEAEAQQETRVVEAMENREQAQDGGKVGADQAKNGVQVVAGRATAPAQAPGATNLAAAAPTQQPQYGFMEAPAAEPAPKAVEQVAVVSEQQPVAQAENQVALAEAQLVEAERVATVDAQRQAVQELEQIVNENQQVVEDIQVAQADPTTNAIADVNGQEAQVQEVQAEHEELVIVPIESHIANTGSIDAPAENHQEHAQLDQQELDYIKRLTTNQMELLQQEEAGRDLESEAVQIVQEIDRPLQLKQDMVKEGEVHQVVLEQEYMPEIEVQDQPADVDVRQLTPERMVGEDDNYEYYYVYEDENEDVTAQAENQDDQARNQ